MTSFSLRVLAFLCLTADGAGIALFPQAGLIRIAGWPAFPLYCFLLSEGFLHTRSRSRYALRLLLLSAACEIPFDLLHFGVPFEPILQNAGWSLLLCLMMLALCEKLRGSRRMLLIPPAACLLAMACGLSFGWLGPALCFAFYACRGNRRRQAAFAFLLPLAYGFTLMLSGAGGNRAWLSLAASLAALPVLFYGGSPGPRGRFWKFFFYLSGPAVLLLLLLLRQSRVIPPWTFG